MTTETEAKGNGKGSGWATADGAGEVPRRAERALARDDNLNRGDGQRRTAKATAQERPFDPTLAGLRVNRAVARFS